MPSQIERLAALTVGTVESVSPSEIRIILEIDAPQSTALNTGTPTGFPRINSYILVPNEAGAVVGLVSWLGVERSAFPKRVGLKDYGLIDLPFPLRKVSLTPVGTLQFIRSPAGQTEYRLARGVSVFPSVGDSALIPTAKQAAAIVTAEGDDRRVQIGNSPLAGNPPISVDPDKVFGRHLAVLGNTGSGKSCTVAGLVRWSLENASRLRATKGKSPRPNARFIILDPNGEYLDVFNDIEGGARVFRVPPIPGGMKELAVPAWMWNSAEWAAFAAAAPGTQRPLLLRALRDMRAGHALAEPALNRLRRTLNFHRRGLEGRIAAGTYGGFPGARETGTAFKNIAEDAVAYAAEIADEPVHTQLGTLRDAAAGAAQSRSWQTANSQGYNDFPEATVAGVVVAIAAVLGLLPALDEATGPSEDAPISFDVAELPDYLDNVASQANVGGGQMAQFISTLTMRIRMMLSDHRLGPLVSSTTVQFEDWLEDYVGSGDASNGNVAIVDLSLVPTDVVHTVIAVISRLIFESTQRYVALNGNELPTVLVLEEAHTFVQRGAAEQGAMPSAQEMCRNTFERIAREGRKFGLGLVLSSQRPSELSQTVLAQCNTFLLHRIVNDRDQELVRRLIPDVLGGMLDELPSLPARQAILLGWASPIPVLVEVNELPEAHRPRSDDPHFWSVWTGESPRAIDWKRIADQWRA